MKPTKEDKKEYDSRPILMKEDDLKEKLREADAGLVVRRYEKTTGRTLRDAERTRLEGIVFRSLSTGRTEREALEEIRRAAR
jgi:hypothetical protein